MGIRFLIITITVLLVSACVAPLKTHEARAPYSDNFYAVSHLFLPLEEGRVYTSAEPSEGFIRWLVEEKGVRKFVSLKGNLTQEKEAVIRSYGAELVIFRWSAERLPPEREIQQVYSLMLGSKEPVLVFCKMGVDRTGLARAYYRFYGQGWSAEHALREYYSFFHIPNVLDEYLIKRFSAGN